MIRTQIYLPQSQLQLLRQTAQEEGTSVSEVIRKRLAVADSKKKTSKNPKTTAGDWLLSLARKAEKNNWKGPKDLAGKVDYYLYGEGSELQKHK